VERDQGLLFRLSFSIREQFLELFRRSQRFQVGTLFHLGRVLEAAFHGMSLQRQRPFRVPLGREPALGIAKLADLAGQRHAAAQKGGRAVGVLGGLIAEAGQLVRDRSEPSEVFFFPLGLTMSIAPAWPQCLGFFGTPLVIEASPGQLSGDAGLLSIRPLDPYIGLTNAFAEALDDVDALIQLCRVHHKAIDGKARAEYTSLIVSGAISE
jgi:hypothetical protein